MSRAVIVFDIDGTLIDTRGSFSWIVKDLTGASDAELELFRNTGGFNDDWELARGLTAWIASGRPKIVERCDTLADLLLWCGADNDPGDLTAACSARYRGEDGHPPLWKDEPLFVRSDQLESLTEVVDVYACSGRSHWEFARAEERLGFTFARATVAEHARKPEPAALVRLIDEGEQPALVVLVGDTHADRLTIKYARKRRADLRFAFVHVDAAVGAAAFVAAVLSDGLAAAVATFADA